MIRVEIRIVGIFFTTKIGNIWIMSVSIHYQRMGDTRSRRHRALDTRLHASIARYNLAGRIFGLCQERQMCCLSHQRTITPNPER